MSPTSTDCRSATRGRGSTAGRRPSSTGTLRVSSAEWVNNTICLDTGVVFGGALTALRYPEREVVSVPAEQQWYEPVRPLAAPTEQAEAREPSVLRIDDVAGTRWLESPHAGKVKIPEENAAAALEVMSRFAVDPRWLVYLPPTMSPAATARTEGYLEHPEQAFEEYASWSVTSVVCEEKHMGSRAVAVLARDAAVARDRFGVDDGTSGAVYTRTGRPFLGEESGLVERVREAVAPLFETLETDWLALDCELLPWSMKALDLVQDTYASVGAAARHGLPRGLELLQAASARGSTSSISPRGSSGGWRTRPRSVRPTPATSPRPAGSTACGSHRSRSLPSRAACWR